MAHNIINIDGSKEREKAIVGSKGSKKYQPWQLSIKYKKKKMQNIEFSLVKENIWSALDYEKIIIFTLWNWNPTHHPGLVVSPLDKTYFFTMICESKTS